jgi:two-component system sensor histidine kinase HydH
MLALGVGAAGLLVGAAVVFWRRARRDDALAAELAQKERLASLGMMSAVLAHEIKNPLAALKGHAQLLVEVLPDGSRPRAQADQVVDAAMRLQGLVGSLLEFVRDGPLDRAPTDPAALPRRAAADAAPGARLDLDGAPPAWSLDAVRVEQVLTNLLRNAAQAAPRGAVEAAVHVAAGELRFVVRDDGPGLPAGEAERIFDPFYTTKARGVGLGLTLARRVVELHHGRITAVTRPAGGAELTVTIPPA